MYIRHTFVHMCVDARGQQPMSFLDCCLHLHFETGPLTQPEAYQFG